MDNPVPAAVDLPTEATSASSMHPRLHRQKLQSKTNRGKTFRSLKNNKAVANIEVRFFNCPPPHFSGSLPAFFFSLTGFAYRSGTGTADYQSVRQSDFIVIRIDRFIRR